MNSTPSRILFLFTLLATACDERPNLQSLAVHAGQSIPPSPTNAQADDPEAALLGQALFFERGMSADGDLACASCHDPDHAFADPAAFSRGSFGRVGNRHAPSLINVAFNEFQLWDGRADCLWAQPIKAIEAEPEGDFTRTEVAHFIAANYAKRYSTVFGPLPALDHLPARAKPGDRAWDRMSAADRFAVNDIAANVGKAIEAYERKLLCLDTPFDLYIRGEGNLSSLALEGAEIFLENDAAGCVNCHSGLNMSDGLFHNLGLDHDGPPDTGRSDGIVALLDDPFNAVGAHSDDVLAGASKLVGVAVVPRRDLGAFKTPGLRGVGQRDRFGHLGDESSLERWIEEVYDRNGGGGRRRGGQRGPTGRGADFVGQLSPLFPRGIQGRSERALAAFLRSFDCPPLPATLTRPPRNFQERDED